MTSVWFWPLRIGQKRNSVRRKKTTTNVERILHMAYGWFYPAAGCCSPQCPNSQFWSQFRSSVPRPFEFVWMHCEYWATLRVSIVVWYLSKPGPAGSHTLWILRIKITKLTSWITMNGENERKKAQLNLRNGKCMALEKCQLNNVCSSFIRTMYDSQLLVANFVTSAYN